MVKKRLKYLEIVKKRPGKAKCLKVSFSAADCTLAACSHYSALVADAIGRCLSLPGANQTHYGTPIGP